MHIWKLFFLFLNQNICCRYSKELSQWDDSFEHPKHMFELMGKEINAILGAQTILIWTYGFVNAQNWSTTRVEIRKIFENIKIISHKGSSYWGLQKNPFRLTKLSPGLKTQVSDSESSWLSKKCLFIFKQVMVLDLCMRKIVLFLNIFEVKRRLFSIATYSGFLCLKILLQEMAVSMTALSIINSMCSLWFHS